ncbi:hypothetical protein JTE90_019426 [Oedothorax gibbosus]|uniref:ZSWIM1/3 RNaseH-like domain-containing protein n=1 Tax=Oedothorax gibbosus TaxID=931172 RepID=A0AAV6TVY4_9ARAC|nr:hypothetical protein JTE90_019426 [Oedothorax gibbosus]
MRSCPQVRVHEETGNVVWSPASWSRRELVHEPLEEDGNGHSDNVAMGIFKNEDKETLDWFFKTFAEKNLASMRTKVAMTDKDLTERTVIKKILPNCNLRLCCFHTLRTFNREVTCDKLGISPAERDHAKTLFEAMSYCQTEVKHIFNFRIRTNTDIYEENLSRKVDQVHYFRNHPLIKGTQENHPTAIVTMSTCPVQNKKLTANEKYKEAMKRANKIYQLIPLRSDEECKKKLQLLDELFLKWNNGSEVKLIDIQGTHSTSQNAPSFQIDHLYALLAILSDETAEEISPPPSENSFEASHTSVNLGEDLKSKLQLWGLEGKVVCVTTDNASNTVGAIAQCLQLEDVKKVVSKLKRMVMFFKQSTVALQSLKENQKHMQMPELKPRQDVETRWNSTYDMVDRFVKNKEPILTTLVVLELALTNFQKIEWELMKSLIAFLEIFHSIMVEISTEKHVSISKLPLLYGFMDGHVKMCRNEYKNRALQEGRILSQQLTDSIPLMALVDVELNFVFVDVGTNGRMSDGGVWAKYALKAALEINDLNAPPATNLPGTI